MRFHKQSRHTDRHRCPCQHRNHLTLTAAARTQTTRQLYRMGGIKHHGRVRFPQNRQTAHIRYQIVVTKARTAFARHEVIIRQTHFSSGIPRFLDDVLHIMRG